MRMTLAFLLLVAIAALAAIDGSTSREAHASSVSSAR
jgi:hypothetical protein